MDGPLTMMTRSFMLALTVSTVTGLWHSKRESWSALPLRRETQLLECTSYVQLQQMVKNSFNEHLWSAFDHIAQTGKAVTSDGLRVFSNQLCRSLAKELTTIDTTIASCSNVNEVRANLHVIGGLCTAEGRTTPFLDSLIADFGESYAFRRECMSQVNPILMACGPEMIEPFKDMEGGPKAYKMQIIDQEKCNARGFDDNDGMGACGNILSLKKLACILDIFHNLGPGVTFDLADFGFDL
ncbi:uncharacterized protein LOC132549446 [Ylistrum balloti]|uniref:uncharacterized protein LOC132549446 n=1 Tax=Ylistrum balloti TaxID=509963 RepID=UPI0029059E7A|nr:uncharacterized protein LOC132549446 [Ylistrum balloti]